MADRTFLIETDVPTKYIRNLMDFIYQKFLLPQPKRFVNVTRQDLDGDPSLSFTVLDGESKPNFNVEIRGSQPVKLTLTQVADGVTEETIDQIRQDATIVVNAFEDNVRRSTIFFAWREGEDIVPEKVRGKERGPINRIFLETQILFFMIFIVISIFLFQVLGLLTPVALLAIQLIFVVYSGKLIARTADWHITQKNPTIHLLEYHRPLEEHDTFREKFPRDELMNLKKEVYEETISKKGEIDHQTTHQIFLKHGLDCKPEDFTSKKVNVHDLVKRTADKFGFPMPEVVVSNTIIPNAAASGPGPGHGVVLITTGLLVQLNDDEIVSVLGHEFGHLKGRDPLLLYGLTAAQYLFLFYVIYSFIASSIFLFFIYFWAVMVIIYFIAKFFEARADLISAIVIGQPQILAQALEKIGFRRLLYERAPSYRVQEWISLEPHPPIYFRVNRLEKITVPVHVKYPLVQSAKDVTRGFLASL